MEQPPNTSPSWRLVDDPIGAPIGPFSVKEGVGSTTLRKMIADGHIRAFRVGRKLMIDVASYREFIAKQQTEGVPEYDATKKAVETRKAKRQQIDLKELGVL